MGGIGWQELLIVLVIVVIIFGGSRLAGVGKASGRAIREFKDEMKGPDAPGVQAKSQAAAELNASGPTVTATPVAPDEATGGRPLGQTELR